MAYEKCNVCEDWGLTRPFYQLESSIEGLLFDPDYVFHRASSFAEGNGLYDGIIVYKYFWERSAIDLIIGSQNIASIARCLCCDCINGSLTLIPHYGDGAYCTTNDELKNSPPPVIQSHGIDIPNMNLRVIIKIIDAGKFRKISKTAGVTRSIPEGQGLRFEQLVFADANAIRVLGFQEWRGDQWEDIAI